MTSYLEYLSPIELHSEELTSIKGTRARIPKLGAAAPQKTFTRQNLPKPAKTREKNGLHSGGSCGYWGGLELSPHPLNGPF